MKSGLRADRAKSNWKVAARRALQITSGAFKVEGRSQRSLVLNESAYLEHLDPRHQYRTQHDEFKQKWGKSSCKSYFDWLERYRKCHPASSRDVFVAYVKDQALGKDTVAEIEDGKMLFKGSFPRKWKDAIESNPDATLLLFVVDREHKLHVSLYAFTEHGRMHHSSFLNGAPVRVAGCMMLDNQYNIKSISNESGHYAPGVEPLYDYVDYLRRNNKIDVERVEVEDSSLDKKPPVKASVFLRQHAMGASKG